jgi:hypothetical protein
MSRFDSEFDLAAGPDLLIEQGRRVVIHRGGAGGQMREVIALVEAAVPTSVPGSGATGEQVTIAVLPRSTSIADDGVGGYTPDEYDAGDRVDLAPPPDFGESAIPDAQRLRPLTAVPRASRRPIVTGGLLRLGVR